MLENMKKMLYDAYCQLYGAQNLPSQCEANGALVTLKRLLRLKYGRNKAFWIIEEQRKKAKFAVLGDDE